MKFCPVVPEICRGQVHVPRKERKEENNNNNNKKKKKRSKNNKSPKRCLGDLKIIEIETKSIPLTHNYMTLHCCPDLVQAFQ